MRMRIHRQTGTWTRKRERFGGGMASNGRIGTRPGPEPDPADKTVGLGPCALHPPDRDCRPIDSTHSLSDDSLNDSAGYAMLSTVIPVKEGLGRIVIGGTIARTQAFGGSQVASWGEKKKLANKVLERVRECL